MAAPTLMAPSYKAPSCYPEHSTTPSSSAPRHQSPFYHPYPFNDPNVRVTRAAAAAAAAAAQQLQQSRQNQLQPINQFLCLNELPRMPEDYSPPLRRVVSKGESGFLRLPTEIRLQIYSLLVLPRRATDLIANYDKVACSTQDYYDYEKKLHGTDRPAIANLSKPTLLIRTFDPQRYQARFTRIEPHARSTYVVRSDRFRARCMKTTYHCVNNPRIEDQLGILRVSKQIHAEAAELLYSSYTFDFDTHIEAIVPFLSDLTPFVRSCVKNIRFVKRALPYEKEFDRAEWTTALRYLTSSSTSIALRRVELGVVAGKPQPSGWDRVAKHNANDFHILKDLEGMEWMQYLLELKNLDDLKVDAVVEHCPPATNSMAMANFIRFSASVEGGFRDFLRQEVLGRV